MKNLSIPVLCLITALATQAAERVVEKNKQVGTSAQATWEYQDGDIFTVVQVNVTHNDVKDQTGKFVDAFAVVSILRIDQSTGNVLVTGSAGAPEGGTFAFTVDGSEDPPPGTPLSAARLTMDAVFHDDGQSLSFPLTVDLAWTATGEEINHADKTRLREPGFSFKSQLKGQHRPAQALGSVLLDGVEMTPVPSASGEIQFNISGSMTVITGTP